MSETRISVPKTYIFKDPVPTPDIHNIYTAAVHDEKKKGVDTGEDNGDAEGEELSVWEEEHKKPSPPTEKKPVWLVRGDLSTSTSVDDMLQLQDLSEDTILLNLRIRYKANLIYTYIGSILIAVNPYRQLPIYSDKHVKQYDGGILGVSNPPHLFAIGNEVFTHMMRDSEDQCLLVSGESGSGKTETVKLLLEYLAKVNASTRSTVTDQILDATPILESFGNAKTIRNHNSSRFGKYLEIIYNGGRILGAQLSQYLLEKSRIVHQHYGERNFHIFYEFLAGISPGVREKLHLKQPNDYHYLSKFDNWQIDGKADVYDFIRSMQCFEVLKFSQLEKDSMFEILAAILHLGNMEYTQTEQMAHGKEILVIETDDLLPIISTQLQINNSKLTPLLTSRFMIIRGEKVSVSLSLSDALNTRDALAKALYSQLFTWLVHKINRIINPTVQQHQSVAVLDIFGFENFRENSFEQLCINYANEQLQSLFNKTIFELEQDRYEQECIKWESLEFPNNEGTVELFSIKPHGLLRVLDDESQFPKATDVTYLEKINRHHDENELYIKPKTERLEFTVQHYAAPVTYNVRGFIQKNKDMLRADIVDLLCSSKNQIVSQVFSDHKESSSMRHLNKITGRMTTLKPRTPTVAASFQGSLSVLLDKINRCKPWFIRCLKPNTSKSAMIFDTDIISEQIKATGMLETVRIRSTGYPVYMPCEDFLERYEYLYRAEPDEDTDASDFCKQILKAEFEAVEVEDYQMGKHHLFLKEAFYQHVEQLRLNVVLHAVKVIENNIKTVLLRRRFLKKHNAAIKIQAFWRSYFHRVAYRNFRKNVSRCQANLRRRWQRQHFDKMRVELTIERDIRWSEADVRKELTRQELKAIIGLEIPADLAFLYNMSSDVPAVHSNKQIIPISNKIFTQNYGLRIPDESNNYIFTNFTESHFQHHLFAAKREAINHPFLIKIRERDYKQAVALFRLVLRFMYDANMSEQKEVLLGNYIIQQVLSSPSLNDELFVQICVQMWAKHQSDTSREKISHLMSMCLSALPPSSALYKYLLKYISDQSFNGYKAVAQYKLLRCFSVDYPSPRYYPPTLLEWHASRKRAKMALPVRLPRGNEVYCHVDSWTTGEDCARLALCAYGLFENRHGWTVELHDESVVYELSGHDHLLDLIGEEEVPTGIPHNVAPLLVSMSKSAGRKTRPDKNSRDRPHRPDVERQPSFDFSDSISDAPSDLMSSISTIRDNLRIVPKPEYAEEAGPSHTPSIPLPPDLPRAKSTVERLQLNMRQRRRDVVMDPTSPRSNGISRQESTTTYHSTSPQDSSSSLQRLEMERSRAELASSVPQLQIKSHSRLNERPANVDHPGMARKSLMNKRYIGSESEATTPRSETTSYIPSASQQTLVQQNGNGAGKSRKPPSVTFRDQVIHPISDSQMNERYTNRQSSKVPPRAMSVKASLNSRYIDTNSDQASVTPRKPEDYWNGLSMETPRYPPPPPLTPPLEVEVLSESLASPGFSRQSSVQEAPITHQDIMSQINNEILGLAQNRYAKKGGRTPAHQDGGAVSKNVAKKKKDQRLATMETNGTMNRSDITGSDLDEWVDKVFDPIMQDDAVQSLTSTGALHRSLKGSGYNQSESDVWVMDLTADLHDMQSLQDGNKLRHILKGDEGDSLLISDTNNNNNNGDVIKNGNDGAMSNGISQETDGTSSNPPLPFSYSESCVPSHLLKPPPSLNNLNAPPSSVSSKRSHSPVGPTAWNMFGHVSHAKIKSNVNSKITNLADKLIANVKTSNEQAQLTEVCSPSHTLDTAVEGVTADTLLHTDHRKYDCDTAYEAGDDAVYDTDDGNTAVTKSGGITRGKAPMKKKAFVSSSVGPDTESDISSVTVSPRSVAISESDATAEANDNNTNNSNNSPARQPAASHKSDDSKPVSSRPRVRSPDIESRAEDLLKGAVRNEQYRPRMEKVGVRVVPLAGEPLSTNNKQHSQPNFGKIKVKKLESSKPKSADQHSESSPIIPKAKTVDSSSTIETKLAIPSMKSGPNLSSVMSAPNLQTPKQVYWEQLKPGEAPVKIIIPSTKKRRRGAESAWTRLLVALKIIKPTISRAESTNSLKEGLTGWKKVRYIVKRYLQEQRKSQELATATLLASASREHREITEALAYESGRYPLTHQEEEPTPDIISITTNKAPAESAPMSDEPKYRKRLSTITGQSLPSISTSNDDVFEIDHRRSAGDVLVPAKKVHVPAWRERLRTSNDETQNIIPQRSWEMVSRSRIQKLRPTRSPSPTQDPGKVLQFALSRLRKTRAPIRDIEIESPNPTISQAEVAYSKLGNTGTTFRDHTVEQTVSDTSTSQTTMVHSNFIAKDLRRHDTKEVYYHAAKPQIQESAAKKPVVNQPKATTELMIPPIKITKDAKDQPESRETTIPWLQQARMKLNRSPNSEVLNSAVGNEAIPDTASPQSGVQSTSSSSVLAAPGRHLLQNQLSVDSDQSSLESPKTVSGRTKKYVKALLSNTKFKTDSKEDMLQRRKSMEKMLIKSADSVLVTRKDSYPTSTNRNSGEIVQSSSEANSNSLKSDENGETSKGSSSTNKVTFLYKTSSAPVDPGTCDSLNEEKTEAINTSITEPDSAPAEPPAQPMSLMPLPMMSQYPHPMYPYPGVPHSASVYYPHHPWTLGHGDMYARPHPAAQPSFDRLTRQPSDTQPSLVIPPPSTFLNPTLSPGPPPDKSNTEQRIIENGAPAGLLKVPQQQINKQDATNTRENGVTDSTGGEITEITKLTCAKPTLSTSNFNNPTISTSNDKQNTHLYNSSVSHASGVSRDALKAEGTPENVSILKSSASSKKPLPSKPRVVVSAIVENNPAYNSARYAEKIDIIKSNNTDERKQEFVRFDSATLDEEFDVVSPLKLSGRITAASMNGAPRKVGKVVWPPVKEEAPKQEKQVGKLLIEESKADKVQGAIELKGPARKPHLDKKSQSQQINNGPAKSLAERLELLEKKIGDRPPPDNPVVQRSVSLAAVSQPLTSSSLMSPGPISAPVTPAVPAVASAPVAVSNGVQRQTSRASVPSPSLPSTPAAEEPTHSNTTAAVNVVSPVVVNGVAKDDPDNDTEKVSERLPVRGVYQQLAAVRTHLHSDESSVYLSYKDVPWWLGVRKEVFSPNETLSNPKTIDLVFYQIVRDVFQYPSVRIPPNGRDEVKKVLGDVTLQNISSQSVNREQRWNVIKLARSWPSYFSRIFMAASDRISDIQFVGVCHDGVRFGKRETLSDDPSQDYLLELQHILFEDISQVSMPRENIFELTAEHKTYKVYTPKAGVLANMVNAYGIESMKGGDFVEATEDHFTCEPGYLSYKKGDVIKLKPARMSFDITSLPAPKPGWLYGSFNGRMGSVSEGTIKPLSRKEVKRAGSFQDTSRSRHSSGMSEGEPSGSQSPGKFSMLEFSMMYFRENLDRYSTRPNEMGINSNIKLIENLKLSGIKRRKSFTKTKDGLNFATLITEQSKKLKSSSYTDKLQRQESWSWKEQADMIKWTKTAIPASLLKLPTDAMNQTAVECFFAVQQFMGDQLLEQGQTDIDCAFSILKACHNSPELRDEIYCQLSRQTTNNKSPQSQSCLRGWRLFTLVACWFSPSDILKPFLINYLQQNASDPSRPYHAAAHNCLQQLRKTIKYGGRKNVPSSEEVAAITDGKLNKRQVILLPGGVPFMLNISPSTVVQDIIDEVCAKLGVVSQMEQEEYTVFAMVESDNEYARLKREEYVMDVITEMRLQRKECTLMLERTSWYFPLRLESATYDYLDMMFSQCIPDYIDGYLLSLDHKNRIPAKQLDDIITIAALLYRASGHDSEPRALKEIDNYLPGPILSLGLLKHQQFLSGVQDRLQRLINFNATDCKLEALNLLRKWPLFGASFFNIQCLTEPKITGECLLAVNRAGVHFLHHKTHRVILSYPFTEIISSRKISGDHKVSDDRFLDIKVGNNMVQKVLRVETSQGSDIAHLIGQYVKAVNNSAKLSV